MKYYNFEDFDAFSASVKDVDCVMKIQNPTQYRWRTGHLYLPDIHVQMGRLGSGNIVEGKSWSNGYIIYMPLTDKCQYRGNGTVFDKNSFLIMEPGCDFCISTEIEHDWCSIFVPTQKFALEGDRIEPSSVSEKTICRVTSPNGQLAKQFLAVISPLMSAASHCLNFESTPAARYAETKLLKVASLIVGQGQAGEPKQKGRQRLSRQEIIRHCKEMLELCDGQPIFVEELATAAQVSKRTLRRVFKEYFGVGPIRYLQLRQLHQVHRVLRALEPEAVSVTDVFVAYGVYEFGRFASRYRKLFGELPSETLRRKRRSKSLNLQ